MHIGSFSTGASSAIAIDRMLARYGRDKCQIVALDTLCEDDDNWRFASDCEARWRKKIVILRDGRDPYQVAEDKHIIPNQKVAPCTFELKINIFTEWLKQQSSPAVIHIGYDIFEAHRCKATKTAYEAQGYSVDFPLLWSPIEHRKYTDIIRDDWGFSPPRTYKLGFEHANCLKKGCVKMGIGAWLRLLDHFPERYAITEAWERKMRDHPTRKNYAILRDQSNGTVTPLTLEQLRQRQESNRQLQPGLFDDITPACHYCGVGDLIGKI